MKSFVAAVTLLLAGIVPGFAIAEEDLLQRDLPLSAAPEHHRVELKQVGR